MMSEDTVTTAIRSTISKCPICEEVGLIKPMEMVPGSGILYNHIHNDGAGPCQWSEFDNAEDSRSGKMDMPSPEIICPQCGAPGVVVAEQDESDILKIDTWNYYVSHPLGEQRCLVSQNHRDIVLKALGRYIEGIEVTATTPTKQRHQDNRQRSKRVSRPKIICPVCNEIGRANIFYDKTRSPGNEQRFRMYHRMSGNKVNVYHNVITPEQKQLFSDRIESTGSVSKVSSPENNIHQLHHPDIHQPRHPPIKIICPRCNEAGTANERKDGSKHGFMYVNHRSPGIRKQHFMTSPEHKQLFHERVQEVSSTNITEIQTPAPVPAPAPITTKITTKDNRAILEENRRLRLKVKKLESVILAGRNALKRYRRWKKREERE
jgi:hypothetical protein